MRGATPLAACALASLTACNVLLGFGEPTEQGAGENDLRVAITPATSPNPALFAFDVGVANDGPDGPIGAGVTITLPAGSQFGPDPCGSPHGNQTTCGLSPIVVGGAKHLLLSATLVTGTIAASVTGSLDPDPSNNAATIMMSAAADLEVFPLNDGIFPLLGANHLQDYTFRVRNNGPGMATDVRVTLQTSAGFTPQSAKGIGWMCDPTMCTLPSLAALTNAYSLKFTVLTPPTVGPSTVTGTIASAGASDPDQSNNSTTYMQTVTKNADLAISLTATPDPVAPSDTLTYSIAVRNIGPSAVAAVTVTDTLPTGVMIVSAGGGGWSCTAAAQTVTCTRPTLDAMDAPMIDLVVTAPLTTGMITNTVSVTSTNPEVDAANNTASITTTVGP